MVTDWTVALLFGRVSSELGRLSHQPELTEHSSGGTGRDGEPARDEVTLA